MAARLAPGTSSDRAGKGKARQLDGDYDDTDGILLLDSSSTQLRVLLASATIPGQSARLDNLHWSANGQALITLKQEIAILTPCLGLYPQSLASYRLPNVESHPRYCDKFQHLVQQIAYRSFHGADPTVRTRSAITKDYSALHPTELEPSWRQADWSPPGLGIAESSLILALGHEHDLYLIGASKNPFGTSWQLLAPFDAEHIRRHVRKEHQKASSSGGESSSGEAVFAPDLAVFRLESRARQIISAAWTESIPVVAGDAAALVVTGTRSGHLAIWQCSRQMPAPCFVACQSIGAWDVLKVCVSPWSTSEKDGAAACLVAAQDREGIVVWRMERTSDEQINLTPAESQPPPFANRMISISQWCGSVLVYATTGEVRLFDSNTANSCVYQLDDGGRDGCDPLQPAASIRPDNDGRACIVTLQDASRYRIHLDAVCSGRGGEGAGIVPLPPSIDQGYVPALGDVQKRYDALQRLHGDAREASPTSSATSLAATVRTYDPVAAMGLSLSSSSRYNLWLESEPGLSTDPRLRAGGLLATALASSEHIDVATLARIRHIFAHYHASSDRNAFAAGLVDAILQISRAALEGALLGLGTGSQAVANGGTGSNSSSDDALRSSQTCLYVAQWLQREHKVDDGETSVAVKLAQSVDWFRSLLFARHLGAGMEMLVAEAEPASSLSKDEANQDVEACTRLVAASHALLTLRDVDRPLSAVRTAWLQRVLQGAEEVLRRLNVSMEEVKMQWDASLRDKGCLETNEECVACRSPLSLKIEGNKGTIEWAQCASGHMWPRCDVTLAPLVSVSVRACSGCWAKSLLPAEPCSSQEPGGEATVIDGEGERTDEERGIEPLSNVLLRGSQMCWACGCSWIHL